MAEQSKPLRRVRTKDHDWVAYGDLNGEHWTGQVWARDGMALRAVAEALRGLAADVDVQAELAEIIERDTP